MLRRAIPFPALRTLCLSAALAALAQAQPVPAGYWTPREPKVYEEYVRIHGNTGFLCILDDKSGYRFTVIGDSITTPWGRKDALVWYPGSGDIVISGVEKGAPYSTRYQMTDSATYAAKCRDRETAFPLATRPRATRATVPAVPRQDRDVLGRWAARLR